MEFKWNPEVHRIGIEVMDEEHKVLIGLIEVLDKNSSTASYDFLGNVLATLRRYTQNHFVHEERLMARMKYERLEEHKKQHRDFAEKLRQIEASMTAKAGTELLINDTLSLLKRWLIRHILVEDKDYVRSLTR